MKRFYSKFRIFLMTFALGLASVFMINGSLQTSTEVFINLPKVKTDNVIVVHPKYKEEMRKNGWDGGAVGGQLYDDYEIPKTIKLHK